MTNTELTEINQKIRCVSHEIRNHISICDMYSQIIRKNLEKAGFHNSSVDKALDCISQSVQIIESNLLDLKSVNANSERIIDFAAAVSCGVDLAKAYIIEKDISIEFYVKNTADLKVDTDRFLAVIVNIIKNGIEAIEIKGKIEVLAEVKNGVGIIKISNNGKPVPKEKREKIFTPDCTTKQNGCGLGLYICRKYLEAQNGVLTLTSSTKAKTTFEIKIPCLPADISGE